jgi:hypothetical protein
MKSATEILREYGIEIMSMDDHFNGQLLTAMERYAESYNANQVGELKEGQHLDEIKPRSSTWLKERENWISEIRSIKEGFVTTLKVLKTIMEKVNLDMGVEKCNSLINQYSQPD